ncbi:MAG: FAD:protein FMN transferase [Pseudomonadales bacterium]|nr:FAD:protein FMN transferase [Pseudomonadales bacterium]
MGNIILPWQKRSKAGLVASLLFLVLMGLSGCSSDSEKYSFSGSTMGTSYHITVVSGSGVNVSSLSDQVQRRLDQLDNIFSTYKPQSELSRLNSTEVGQPFSLSPEMLDVLSLSQELYQATSEAFNPAIGPLVDLWGFGPMPAGEQLPDDDQITERLLMVDFSQLVIGENESVAIKQRPLQIDLSAVAKGYAVDQVAELLEAKHFHDYLVEIGGELRLSGLNQQNEPWRIGIERPALERGAAQEIMSLSDTGLATSGDYRNYIDRDGVRYSHTIDPLTGKPVINRLASVTVIHPNAASADALATAFMVMGESKAMQYAESENIAAYFIVKDDKSFSERHSNAFNVLLDNVNEKIKN